MPTRRTHRQRPEFGLAAALWTRDPAGLRTLARVAGSREFTDMKTLWIGPARAGPPASGKDRSSAGVGSRPR